MASIQTGIELQDNFTSVMYGIIGAANEANYAFSDLQSTMNESVGYSPYDEVQADIQQTATNLEEAAQNQNNFNNELQSGVSHADSLMNTVKRLVGTYATMKTVQSVLNTSDELATTTARLNLMNDNLQTTQELENMIYVAAQNARGSFSDMASSVAKLGNLAGDAFGSSAEIVAFAEQLNKQMKLSGASTQEASSAMLQLTQSLAKGTLNGDELTSVMENGSMVVQTIADYMGVTQGEIKDLAADGKVTSDIIIAAMLGAADETNAAFESLPMTWADMWQNMKNGALIAFQPVLQRINDFANSTAVQEFANSAIQAFAVLAAIALDVFNFMESGAAFISDNWSIISPIVYGIAAALAVYYAWQLLCAAATGVMQLAQAALNAVMSANPIMLVVLAIIALIAIFYAAVAAVNKFAGTSVSATGLIGAAFAVLGARIINTFIVPAQNGFAALANFLGNVFNNPVAAIKVLFYDMCLTVIGYIQNLASAIETLINKIPGVTVDITSGLDGFYAGLEQAQQAVKDQSGWVEYVQKMDYIDYSDAAAKGYSFGEGIADKVSNFSLSDIFGQTDIPNVSDYTSGFNDVIANSGVGDGVKNIDENTGKIRDEVSASQEDLKYLRDIAEQEAINRFTTAEIKIDMSGMQNTVNSGDDIDGFMTKLTDSVNDAVDNMTEGVHE